MASATSIHRKLISHLHVEELKTMKKLNPLTHIHVIASYLRSQCVLFYLFCVLPYHSVLPHTWSSLIHLLSSCSASNAFFVCVTESFISEYSLLLPSAPLTSAHFAHPSLNICSYTIRTLVQASSTLRPGIRLCFTCAVATVAISFRFSQSLFLFSLFGFAFLLETLLYLETKPSLWFL